MSKYDEGLNTYYHKLFMITCKVIYNTEKNPYYRYRYFRGERIEDVEEKFRHWCKDNLDDEIVEAIIEPVEEWELDYIKKYETIY